MSDQAKIIASTIISHLQSSGNLSLLSEVVEILRDSSEYKKSHNRVVLSSAIEIDATSLKGIESYLKSSIGKSYDLVKIVDPDLVAGFTLQINDTFIDASVLGKINTVSNKLTAKD